MPVKRPTLFFVEALRWRFPNIVQQCRPAQPNIVCVRANIVNYFQRVIKIVFVGLPLDFLHLF